MPKIRMTLSSSSVAAAIKQLEAYQKGVNDLAPELVKRVTKDGAETAKDVASFMDIYDTGMLVDAINGEADGLKGYVKSDAPYSAFVEFGTGVVGERQPDPQAAAFGWKYDVNEHGEAGWVYFDERYGRFFWTKGMPSRPFMYDAAQIMKENVPEQAKDILKKQGGG